MDEKARKTRAAYYRAWRRRNPEKVKAINERYWSKKARLAEELESIDYRTDHMDERSVTK